MMDVDTRTEALLTGEYVKDLLTEIEGLARSLESRALFQTAEENQRDAAEIADCALLGYVMLRFAL